MMMAVLMCATSVFNKAYADTPDCWVWMLGMDSSNDGWDGSGHVLIQQDGQSDQTFTVAGANYAAQIGYYANDKKMDFIWKAGSYQNENTLFIFSPLGGVYYEQGSLETTTDGTVLYTIPAGTPCPTEGHIKNNDAVVNPDNTITLSWDYTDTEKADAVFLYFIVKSDGTIVDYNAVSEKTKTIGPADADGEYTVIIAAAKDDGKTIYEAASKTQTIELNKLGDVNVKIMFDASWAALFGDTYRHYIFYRTANDLAVQNSIQLTKNGDWWTGTISKFPAASMKLCWYATESDGTLCIDETAFGTTPFTVFSDDYFTVTLENKDNCCFEMLASSSNFYLEQVPCNKTLKDHSPKDLATTITDGKVVFKWSNVDEAAKYYLWAGYDNGSSSTFEIYPTENSYIWFPNEGAEFKLKSWMVAPMNKNSLFLIFPFGAPSITDEVTVPASTPLTPKNILPAYDAHAKKVTATWDKVDDAVFYKVRVVNSADVTKRNGSTNKTEIEFDAKDLDNDTYKVYVEPWYQDKNGTQQMAPAGEATLGVTLTAMEDVEVNVLVPSDCRSNDVDFDASKPLYLYTYSVSAAQWGRHDATDKGGRWYGFTFNEPTEKSVKVQLANEKLEGTALEVSTLAFNAATDKTGEFLINRSTCLELTGTTTAHLFNQEEVDCDATDHDYLPRNLRADYETAGRAQFTWKTNSGVDHYTIQITTTEYTFTETKVKTPAYTFVADQVYHVKSWTVRSYDAHDHVLATVTKTEEFTVQKGTNDLKPSDLKVETKDGKSFTFSWKPAKDAASYLLQVGQNAVYYENYLTDISNYANGISLVATDTFVTHSFYLQGTTKWGIYSVDKDGLKMAFAEGPTFNVQEDAEFTATNIQTKLDGNKLTLSWQTNAPAANIYINGVIDTYLEGNSITVPVSKGGWVTWDLYAAEKDDLGNWRYFDVMESGKVYVDPQYSYLNYYEVSLTATIGGSVTGAGKYADGENATIKATADKGYVFDQWSDGDKNATRTIKVTKDIMLQAKFRVAQLFSVSLGVEPAEGGYVKANGSKSNNEKVYEGSSISLEAVANTGYQFKEWKVDGFHEGSNDKFTFSPKASAAVVAVFELIPNGLQDLAAEGYSLQQTGNRLTVTAKEATDIALYNAAGQLISRTNAAQAQFTLPTAGMYIVRIGDKAVKLISK